MYKKRWELLSEKDLISHLNYINVNRFVEEKFNNQLDKEWQNHIKYIKEIAYKPIGGEISLKDACIITENIIENHIQTTMKWYDLNMHFLKWYIENNKILDIKQPNLFHQVEQEFHKNNLSDLFKDQIEEDKDTILKIITKILEINNTK